MENLRLISVSFVQSEAIVSVNSTGVKYFVGFYFEKSYLSSVVSVSVVLFVLMWHAVPSVCRNNNSKTLVSYTVS